MKEKINIFLTKLKEKRNILISNPSSFEQKFSITLSRLSFIIISLIFILLLSLSVYLVISYTSLKHFIPGYPDSELTQKINETDIKNLQELTEIQKQNRNRNLWIKNLTNILNDNDSVFLNDVKLALNKDSANYKNIIFERPIEDSILRNKVEQENILMEEDAIEGMLKKLNFTPPVFGTIIKNQYTKLGADLKTELNHSVIASMKGIVISKTPNSAVIQHPNNVVSVYKNCITLQLSEGESVARGRQIGVVADSIFHFELWFNGKSVNPKKYLLD